MTPSDFAYLRRCLKNICGLDLPVEANSLVEARLMPLARRKGCESIDDLMRLVKTGDGGVITRVVETMLTMETSFFRDRTPFEDLREMILPALLRARASRRSLRIWSAACSTGQEPYSIAMCIREMGDLFAGWHVDIVATDLSQTALRRSEAAIFSQYEVQRGLPIHLLLRYFTQLDDTPMGKAWQANAGLRAMVTHRPFNLLHDCAQLGTFDVIFCRNVMIGFDRDTRTTAFKQLAGALETDGYLALGGAETVLGVTDAFAPHADRRGVFRRELRSPSLAPHMMPFKVVAG